jgi:hypothetical protein
LAGCIAPHSGANSGFPNLVLARDAKAERRRLRLLEEWKRKELRRTPFAILDDPPDELRPKNRRK